MAAVTVQRVKQASDTLFDACASMVATLMRDNLAAISICGGDISLLHLSALGMVRACALEGELYTATNDDNDLVGFCAWMPPGKQIFSTDAQRQVGLNDFMARLPEPGKEYYRTMFFTEFPAFVTTCLGGDPKWKTKYWWLHTLMVRPENHRQGVARALMQPVREKAAQAQDSIALSTTVEDNIPKYTGLGFRLVGRTVMPSPWGDWPLIVFSWESPVP